MSAFNAIDTPQYIVVFGSGVEAINGRYERSQFPQLYEKEGEWEGQNTTFLVTYLSAYTSFAENLTDRWLISAKEKVFFQSSPCDVSLLPPSRVWWRNSVKELPPVIFYGDEKLIDWRLPSEESFADYEIEVYSNSDDNGGVNGSETVTNYHVHRAVLANMSHYFINLLRPTSDGRQNKFSEAENRKSRIELKECAAQVFPGFLDLLYNQFSNRGVGRLQPFCCKEAVLLYWLVDYFQVNSLAGPLQEAVLCNMWRADIGVQVHLAQRLGLHCLIEKASSMCAERLSSLVNDTILSLAHNQVDASFLLSICQKSSALSSSSYKASQVIGFFFNTASTH